jgi:hypothetical protein
MSIPLKEQFSLLIKDNKGNALEKIISQILSSDIYITADFLLSENIKALGENNKYYSTLVLFSNLVYLDYEKEKSKYIDLTPEMIKKLKIVSILEYAKTNKCLDYNFLKEQLKIKENFELETLLFEIISKDLIKGRVDMMKEKVKIISVKPRKNLTDVEKAKSEIENLLININEASNYIEEQEMKLNEDNKIYQTLIEKV